MIMMMMMTMTMMIVTVFQTKKGESFSVTNPVNFIITPVKKS